MSIGPVILNKTQAPLGAKSNIAHLKELLSFGVLAGYKHLTPTGPGTDFPHIKASQSAKTMSPPSLSLQNHFRNRMLSGVGDGNVC